jgi:hypothetical protein
MENPIKMNEHWGQPGMDEKRFLPGQSRFTDLVDRWKPSIFRSRDDANGNGQTIYGLW